jgi:arabinogalactan oligomer/maltooligosaccharide transport system substrate-binding protein
MSNMVGCKGVAQVPSWAWTKTQQKADVKAALQGSTYKGKIYAIPYAIETTGIFYNKAMIPTSFWKPTKGNKYVTWTQVINKAKSFGENKGIGWDIANLYFDYFALSGNGGYVFKYVKGKGFEASKIGLNTSGTLKGIEWLNSLSNNGKYDLFNSSMNDAVASALFSGGKLPMYLSGPWEEASFVAKGIKYGFAADPSFDGKHPSHPFSGVQQFSVSGFSKNQTDAFAFLAYMIPRFGLNLYKVNGRPPVEKSLLNSKTVQGNAVGRAVAAAALAASPMPNIPEMATVWTPFSNNMTDMYQGKATPQQVVSTTYQQVKQAIAKLHSGG